MVEVTTTCIKGLLRNAENHCCSVTGVAPELATDTLILTEGLHPNKTFKGQRVAN